MFLTVIIRVYNREKDIIRCINSVLKQIDIEDVQILIINDGSTDNTLSVINKIKDENPNVCIDIITHYRNMGRGKALNTSKEYIKGLYCQILDSDDEWYNKNHVKELKDKLIGTNYKYITWYIGCLHMYNVYLSEIFKKAHINNINYYEDHYSIELFNLYNDNILFFDNNYYKQNIQSEDRNNGGYLRCEKFFSLNLYYLYEDVFYHRYKHNDIDLINRVQTFDITELHDEVLIESFNEIKKELNIE